MIWCKNPKKESDTGSITLHNCWWWWSVEKRKQMELQTMGSLSCLLLLLLSTAASTVFSSDIITRDDFPPGFIFGSGTSAYQVEGAANEDGRTATIFDTYAVNLPGGNGDIACDEYHKYKEDVQLMVDTGLDAYRFSISWARLIPNGRGPVNPKGLEYYNNLINELISHGIQPHVTLHHCDLPQALEDEYGGWLSRNIVKDFTLYADVCFREFGDRVPYWTTLNEANIFVLGGYDVGFMPPQRCSSPFGYNCSKGNSPTEPYLAAHYMLLAHAAAAKLYKKKYQDKQHGFIGLNLFAFGFVPFTNTTEDAIATQRANSFYLGWFVEPLLYGGYPNIMKKNVGSRIPTFTSHESKLVKGSFDFLALNHYFTIYIKDNPSSLKKDPRNFNMDMAVEFKFMRDDPPTFELPIRSEGFPGVLEYLKRESPQLPMRPEGLQVLLEYFKQAYGNPPIYIHENGLRTERSPSLNDTPRVEYMKGFIGSLLDAVRNGSNARGYFTWAFLDVYELMGGYESTYGLYYVDLEDPDLKRYPKLSAQWYSNFLKGRSISSDGVIEVEKNLSELSHAHFFQ